MIQMSEFKLYARHVMRFKIIGSTGAQISHS